MLAFMDKATRADDLIQFSNQLGEVQEEIERIKGRIRYLDENVAFSTVHLRLYQGTGNAASIEKEDSKHFGDRLYSALSGSAKTLRQFGEGLLVVLAALLPVLVAAAVIGVPVYAIVRKRAAARRRDSHNRRKEWNARLSDTGGEREDDEAARPSAEDGASSEPRGELHGTASATANADPIADPQDDPAADPRSEPEKSSVEDDPGNKRNS